MKTTLTFGTFVLVFCLTHLGSSYAQAPVDVGARKQLFLDGLFIESAQNVSLRVQPPHKTDEIVLRKEHPWEDALINWFGVMQDPGQIDKQAKYRMWYEAYDVAGWPTGSDTSFCYAESRDGVHWTKPELGLCEYQGSKKNNVLFRDIGPAGAHSRVHGTCVFRDPTAPPASRYKAVSQGVFQSVGKPPHRIAGMFSADGLRWTRYATPICNVFADSQYSAFWDVRLKKYVLFGRVFEPTTAVGRTESDEFSHFQPPQLVLQTNADDPPKSMFYNSAVMQYPFAERVYLMFPSRYDLSRETLDIRLAVSRDGVHWSRPDQAVAWIPLGERGAWDSGSLYIGHGMLRVGDQLWQYYSGASMKHNETTLENLTQGKQERFFSRIIIQLDRFVSVAADATGGTFVTPPLQFTGEALRINMQVAPGGSVRIGLLDENSQPVPGLGLTDCQPIEGDAIAHTVRWKQGNSVAMRSGKPTRMQVELKDARLYAFLFTAAQ